MGKDAHVLTLSCTEMGSSHRDEGERGEVANEGARCPQGEDGGLCQSGAG